MYQKEMLIYRIGLRIILMADLFTKWLCQNKHRTPLENIGLLLDQYQHNQDGGVVICVAYNSSKV